MASPVTTQMVRPLDGLQFDTSGPRELTGLVAEHCGSWEPVRTRCPMRRQTPGPRGSCWLAAVTSLMKHRSPGRRPR